MTETEVLETMIGWTNSVTGLTPIKAHQSGNRPDLPYIMANLVNSREVRDHECGLDYGADTEDGEVDITIGIETEWMISLHCYGENATEPLAKLRNRYRLPDDQRAIAPLVVHEIGRINNVPEFIKNRWEKRAQCNLFVRGIASENATTDTIESAPITISPLPTTP